MITSPRVHRSSYQLQYAHVAFGPTLRLPGAPPSFFWGVRSEDLPQCGLPHWGGWVRIHTAILTRAIILLIFNAGVAKEVSQLAIIGISSAALGATLDMV